MIENAALAATVLAVVTCVSGATPARAQEASITGRGTYGTATNSYICPAIVMFSHGETAFDLRVSGKQDGPGEATGTLRATCIGYDSHIDLMAVTTIVQISEKTAWVQALYDLQSAGYSNCVDRSGQAKRRIVLDVQIQAGAAGTSPEPTIHISSTVPPGGISCEDPSTRENVIFQNFDGGAHGLASGSITITTARRTNSD
jgi:hypothetical protein